MDDIVSGRIWKRNIRNGGVTQSRIVPNPLDPSTPQRTCSYQPYSTWIRAVLPMMWIGHGDMGDQFMELNFNTAIGSLEIVIYDRMGCSLTTSICIRNKRL